MVLESVHQNVATPTSEATTVSDAVPAKESATNSETTAAGNEAIKLVQEFGHATAYGAIQTPIDGIQQLANWGLKQGGMSTLPPLQIVEPLKEAEFNSSKWYAQTLGTGVGMVLGFVATERLGSRAMAVGRAGQGAEIGNAALGAKRLGQLGQIPGLKMAGTGFAFGALTMPASDIDAPDFIQQRLKNGVVTAASGALIHLGGGTLGKSASSFLPGVPQSVIRPMANVVAGYGTGVMNAELNSVLEGHGLTSDLKTLHKEGLTWAVMGLGSEAAGLGMARAQAKAEKPTEPVVSSAEARSNEPSTRYEPSRDVSKWTPEQVEALRAQVKDVTGLTSEAKINSFISDLQSSTTGWAESQARITELRAQQLTAREQLRGPDGEVDRTKIRKDHAETTRELGKAARERADHVQESINRFNAENGLPPIRVEIIQDGSPYVGSYQDGVIKIKRSQLLGGNAAEVIGIAYHEAAHHAHQVKIVELAADTAGVQKLSADGAKSTSELAQIGQEYKKLTNMEVPDSFVQQVLELRDGRPLSPEQSAIASKLAESISNGRQLDQAYFKAGEDFNVVDSYLKRLQGDSATPTANEIVSTLAKSGADSTLKQRLFGEKIPHSVQELLTQYNKTNSIADEAAAQKILVDALTQNQIELNALRERLYDQYSEQLHERDALAAGEFARQQVRQNNGANATTRDGNSRYFEDPLEAGAKPDLSDAFHDVGHPTSHRWVENKEVFVSQKKGNKILDDILDSKLFESLEGPKANEAYDAVDVLRKQLNGTYMTQAEYKKLTEVLEKADRLTKEEALKIFTEITDFAAHSHASRKAFINMSETTPVIPISHENWHAYREALNAALQSGNKAHIDLINKANRLLEKNLRELSPEEIETYLLRLTEHDSSLLSDIEAYRSPSEILAQEQRRTEVEQRKQKLERLGEPEKHTVLKADVRVEKLSLPEVKKAEIREQLKETRKMLAEARENLTDSLINTMSKTNAQFDKAQLRQQLLESDLSPRAIAKLRQAMVNGGTSRAQQIAADAQAGRLQVEMPFGTASNATYERLLTDMAVSSHVAQSHGTNAPGMQTYAADVKALIEKNIAGIRDGVSVPTLIDGTIGKTYGTGETEIATPINPAGRETACTAAAGAEAQNRQLSPAELLLAINPGTQPRKSRGNYIDAVKYDGRRSDRDFLTSFVPIRDGIPITTAEHYQSHYGDKTGEVVPVADPISKRPAYGDLPDGIYKVHTHNLAPDGSVQGHVTILEIKDGLAQAYDPLRGRIQVETYDYLDTAQKQQIDRMRTPLVDNPRLQSLLGLEYVGPSGQNWVPE